MEIKLRFWQSGNILSNIAKLFNKWWAKILIDLDFLNIYKNLDEENSPIEIVDLLAYERGINRINNEPEKLYRLRVKYAYINAIDSGSVAGFQKIWQRLGLGVIEQKERIADFDWDIISLTLDRSHFENNLELLDELIRLYGRTCRRYVMIDKLDVKVYIGSATHSCITSSIIANCKI